MWGRKWAPIASTSHGPCKVDHQSRDWCWFFYLGDRGPNTIMQTHGLSPTWGGSWKKNLSSSLLMFKFFFFFLINAGTTIELECMLQLNSVILKERRVEDKLNFCIGISTNCQINKEYHSHCRENGGIVLSYIKTNLSMLSVVIFFLSWKFQGCLSSTWNSSAKESVFNTAVIATDGSSKVGTVFHWHENDWKGEQIAVWNEASAACWASTLLANCLQLLQASVNN